MENANAGRGSGSRKHKPQDAGSTWFIRAIARNLQACWRFSKNPRRGALSLRGRRKRYKSIGDIIIKIPRRCTYPCTIFVSRKRLSTLIIVLRSFERSFAIERAASFLLSIWVLNMEVIISMNTESPLFIFFFFYFSFWKFFPFFSEGFSLVTLCYTG